MANTLVRSLVSSIGITLSVSAWAGPARLPDVVRLDNGTTTVNMPPVENGPFTQVDLVELVRIDPALGLDIRYATPNNFTGQTVYPEARAFLQRPAAEALARADRRLQRHGFGMVVMDGYRPWAVTKKFWDITSAANKEFVADPALGSRHNRGCAVDVTLCDLETSRPVPMPSGYDEMTSRSYPYFAGAAPDESRNRDLLRKAMEAEGFTVYPTEWWHFDYKGWEKYPILDVRFGDIQTAGKSSETTVTR